jgi:hypothetical protein
LGSDTLQVADVAASGDPEVLAAHLRRTGDPFLLLGELRHDRARVRFTGPFEGADVVWDCEFRALQSPQRSFIDIGQPTAGGVPLRVGLNLARIDRSAILKMIVMIRNYRRLRRGRHEFGGSPR